MLNLDNLSIDELKVFVEEASANEKALADKTFPDKPPRHVRAINLMRKYAIERIEVLDSALKGRDDKMKKQEKLCNNYYRSLPDYAKWLEENGN